VVRLRDMAIRRSVFMEWDVAIATQCVNSELSDITFENRQVGEPWRRPFDSSPDPDWPKRT
jgi:hypothetical protein